MKKVSKPKKGKPTVTPSRDQYTVVLEDIQSQMKFLAEGQQILREEVKFLADGQQALREEVKSSFQQVFEYLSRIEDEIVEIRLDIADLRKKKVDWIVVQALEKRLEKVEKELQRQKSIAKVR